MPLANVFNDMSVKITLLRSITKNLKGVCNAVYFRLCIDLMPFTPPVTPEGYDGSHHPRCAECPICIKKIAIRTTFSHMINIAGMIYYTCNFVVDI